MNVPFRPNIKGHTAARLLLLIALLAQCVVVEHAYAATDAPAISTGASSSTFKLVKNINTEPQTMSGLSGNNVVASIHGQTLFVARTAAQGKELWRTDSSGDANHTQLVKDINPGNEDAFNYYAAVATVLSDTLLFPATDGALGQELWRSDGTAAGTYLLKDTWPGTDGGYPHNFLLSADGRIFFTAQISETRSALWITDGTSEGTVLLHTFSSIEDLSALMSGTLMFAAADQQNNIELWKSDGTPDGTVLVKDIYEGPEASSPRDLTRLSDTMIVFSARDTSHGRELWRSDGSADGTVMVKEINPTMADSMPSEFAFIQGSTALNGPDRIVFSAFDFKHGSELWVTGGHEADTQLLVEAAPGFASGNPNFLGYAPRADAFSPTRAYYSMTDGTHGRELWITDGSTANTTLLVDINPNGFDGMPRNIILAAGTTFFTARTETNGEELWKTDGNLPSTMQLADIYSGTQSSNISSLTRFGNTLYFVAEDELHGRELWRSDGTPEGTQMVKDIWAGPEGGVGDILGVANGLLYFEADDGSTGYELWQTDGQANGTHIVKNIWADVGGIYVSSLYNAAPLGDKLLLGLNFGGITLNAAQVHAINNPIDNTLWQSDGTLTGTYALKSFPNVGYGGAPYQLRAMKDGVVFGAADNLGVSELWRSDGSTGGTMILTNTVKPYFGYPTGMTRLKDWNIFAVYTGTQPNQNEDFVSMWRSDGTPQNTQMITTGLQFGNRNRIVSGNILFFSGNRIDTSDQTHYDDEELWKTDGTAAGTLLVKDIVSGTTGSYPSYFAAGEPGSVFFTIYSETVGTQLWKSDGSEDGTLLVADIRTVDRGNEFESLAYISGTLFLAINDGVNGTELWTSDGTLTSTVMLKDIYPGYGSSYPDGFIGYKGMLYFSATTPDGERTLWRSDGTANGTHPVRADADAPINPTYLDIVQGQLMFSAADATHGRELWRSDGSANGTVMLQDLASGNESGNPTDFIETNAQIFLSADHPVAGRELWARAKSSPIDPTPIPPTATPIATPASPTATPDPISLTQKTYLPTLWR